MSGLDDRYRGDGYAASGYRREQALTGPEASEIRIHSRCWAGEFHPRNTGTGGPSLFP
ncbi:hypothetical protein WGM54_20005 [Paenibacillus polymyxa]|uniref:hypothetical protein n=1 Tax=Paenibacillus polymyxa TaxID=1406 RepID=UPI00307F2067